MLKRKRFIIGGLIILAALSYIIYGGMEQAIVYFVTPSELRATESVSNDKFLRMGGMVVTGSLQKDVKNGSAEKPFHDFMLFLDLRGERMR